MATRSGTSLEKLDLPSALFALVLKQRHISLPVTVPIVCSISSQLTILGLLRQPQNLRCHKTLHVKSTIDCEGHVRREQYDEKHNQQANRQIRSLRMPAITAERTIPADLGSTRPATLEKRSVHRYRLHRRCHAPLQAVTQISLGEGSREGRGLALPGVCPEASATETSLSPVPRCDDSRHREMPGDTATAVSGPPVRFPRSELRMHLDRFAPRTADRWRGTSCVDPSRLRLHNPGLDRRMPCRRQESHSREPDARRKNLPLDPSSVPSRPDLFHLHLA